MCVPCVTRAGKAFDSFHKLYCLHGITGSTLNLLSSYFKGKNLSVVIAGTSSESKELKTGFPWGFVLGPYLYPLYLSELFEIAEKHGINIHMYADDTPLYIAYNPAHLMRLCNS